MAALGEDAGEEGFAGFKGGSGILPLFAGTKRRDAASTLECGFGGDEAAFAGGFEDGGAVTFEVGLHPPQRRHPRLQPRELLLNLRHNPPLFGEGWEWERKPRDLWLADGCHADNLLRVLREVTTACGKQPVAHEFRRHQVASNADADVFALENASLKPGRNCDRFAHQLAAVDPVHEQVAGQ